MSRKHGGSLTSDWQKLEAQLAKAKAQPKLEAPTKLALGSIRLRPNVFQHRDPNQHEGTAHVRKLVEAIGRSKTRTLEPLIVWWDGRTWTGIDGHHRHAAYTAAAVGANHLVPVEVFEGSLGAAMAQAAAGNSRNKRAMTTGEKTQAAWRMVVMDDSLSKATVADAAGVSQGSVANMRRVHKQLCEAAEDASFDAPNGDHRDLRWLDAKRIADGGEARDVDWKSKDEKEAIAMAAAIRKAIGDRGSKKLHVLAHALEIYDSRLADALIEHWSERDTEDDDSDPQ
ncbi:MAG: hypothetical protein H7337_14575 [Rhizobacter sp.]|nr:hypothetical protein [Rhizobacter sp.]